MAAPAELRLAPVWRRRLIALAALLVTCSIATPALAAAQSPTPSGKNLRQAYPLHPKPSATPPSVAARPVRQRTPAPAPSEGGYDITPIIALLAVAVCAVAAFVVGAVLGEAATLRRRHREGGTVSSDEGDAQNGSSPMPTLAIFKPARDTPAQPRAPGSRARFGGASPPDRAKEWRAEIVWRESDGESRFVVSGRSEGDEETVVLTSDPIAWPPRGPDEVGALEQVVGELDATMQRGGWSKLEPGEAWYARRFSWEPQNETDDPVAAPPSSSASGKVGHG